MVLSAQNVEIRRHTSDSPWNYSALDCRQREIAERARGGAVGAVLLSEVSPVITCGRRTAATDLLLSPEQLAGRGVELYRTDRGGLATYHGPGQWVLFVVDRLEALTGDRRGVRLAVEGLLNIGLEVGRLYDTRTEIRTGAEMGVWSKRGKIASVGVHIERGVLLHGLAVNGFRTENSFVGLRPCGLDAPVDYLLSDVAEDVRGAAFEKLGQALISRVFQQFWRSSCAEQGSFLAG